MKQPAQSPTNGFVKASQLDDKYMAFANTNGRNILAPIFIPASHKNTRII